MEEAGQDVYCTLLMSDNYLSGAMVLAHSLRDNGTKKQLAVLVTLDTISASAVDQLKSVYDHVISVDRIVNKSPANLYLMNRPDLASTFTKINLWRQTQFRRILYIDADVISLRAPDELFQLESHFAAVPDIGWPDCFNSGVMALSPNMGDYYALLALAQRGISFDGADQGLLNMHFRNWERMSFTYNCTPSGNYQYVPAYRHFQSSINMVHYIGHDKPWIIGREGSGATGVYEELLGRWWAVYDKHFRTPVTTTELPFTEKAEPAESIAQGETMPMPTAEQRQFSAPMADWDPVRQPPPANARPEASNFPTHSYNMSADRNLFQAPKAYPRPPPGMWYEVPKSSPTDDRPKPIFPWEQTQTKPTRVFAEDKPSSPEQTPSITTDEDTAADPMSPSTPIIQVTNLEPFATFDRTNAWDDVPEIERYVSAIASSRKARVQVLVGGQTPGEDVLSPGGEDPPPRRPSMKLTDFPTEFERPSLPVTPAPVRRPTFWGEERNAAGNLPGAEGVPKQEDWDPVAKLEELQRRQSEVLAQGPASPSNDIPDRKLPNSAVLLPTSEETMIPPTSVMEPHLPLSGGASPHGLNDRSVFDFDFGNRNPQRSGEDEGVFSPTES